MGNAGGLLVLVGFALGSIALIAALLVFFGWGRVSWPLFGISLLSFTFGIHGRRLVKRRRD